MVPGESPTAAAIRSELGDGLQGLLGKTVPLSDKIDGDGALVVVNMNSTLAAKLAWKRQLTDSGPEGFQIRTQLLDGHQVTVIAAETEIGSLYGAFYFLRLVQTLRPLERINVSEKPRLQLRLLDHWDNLDGSIERGYAGKSLWNWNELPDKIDPRLRDYARANASIGINGSALNNVNANSQFLSAEYLRKVTAIADVFRPFGIRVPVGALLCPDRIGWIETADPLDPDVAGWWKTRPAKSTG